MRRFLLLVTLAALSAVPARPPIDWPYYPSIVKSTRPGGSGFGLFYVSEIARALGGTVQCCRDRERGETCSELFIRQEA